MAYNSKNQKIKNQLPSNFLPSLATYSQKTEIYEQNQEDFTENVKKLRISTQIRKIKKNPQSATKSVVKSFRKLRVLKNGIEYS